MRFKITIAIAIALLALGLRSLVSFEGDRAPVEAEIQSNDLATVTPPLDSSAP